MLAAKLRAPYAPVEQLFSQSCLMTSDQKPPDSSSKTLHAHAPRSMHHPERLVSRPPEPFLSQPWRTVFVTWITPLLQLGTRRPLDVLDLCPIPECFSAQHLTDLLAAKWTYMTAEKKPGPLLRSLASVFGPTFFMGGLFLLAEFTILLPPLILRMLTAFKKSEEDGSPLVPWPFAGTVPQEHFFLVGCLLMFAIQALSIVSLNTYFMIIRYLGIKVRTAVSGLIYRKSLKLTCDARQKYSSGKIVNLMSVDSSRIEAAATCLHYMWTGPSVIIAIISLLYGILGVFAFLGLALLVVFMPIQNRIFKSMSKYRQLATKHSDERIKKMQEVIYGIRVIKFYCWEQSIIDSLVAIRNLELAAVQKIVLIKAATATITTAIPTFACILTFLAYRAWGNELSSDKIIVCLIFFGRLKVPLFLIPMLASFVADGRVSMKRVEEYLLAEELDFNPELSLLSDNAVVIENGNFDWKSPRPASAQVPIADPVPPASDTDGDGDSEEDEHEAVEFTGLHSLNLQLPRGKLIAVVGPIGAGKSSLLNALVGEMRMDPTSRVVFSGSVGYSPQQAWIQNATIRENITFGRPFSAKLYHAVLKACALEKDLRLFVDGDQTEIGEKGANLSGGQKQRINLARLAYSDADILLMDDPLSAVDAHVGKHLFTHLLRSFLHNKTRILVTHQLQYLKQVDSIVFMKDGHIEALGTYQQLMRSSPCFAKMLALAAEEDTPDSPTEVSTSPIDVASSALEGAGAASTGTLPAYEENEDTAKSAARLMAREERTYGAVKMSVFLEYVRFAGGQSVALQVLGAVALVQLTRVCSDLFVTQFSAGKLGKLSFSTFSGIYISLGCAVAVAGLLFSVALSLAGIRAGRRLFREATQGVLSAPTSFFDTNPAGRIINRFSKDQDAIDNLLPESLRHVLSTFGQIASTLVFVLVTTNGVALIFLIPLGIAYNHFQMLYRNSSRELKRLDNLTKSPLIAQFAETLTGLSTIRAYARQSLFSQRNAQLLDANNQPVFLQISAERWAANRLEIFGALLAVITGLCCEFFGEKFMRSTGDKQASLAVLMGMAVGYALEVSVSLNWGIRQIADMESQIVSTERLSHYANNLPCEGEPAGPTCQAEAAKDWPQQGQIEFKNVVVGYRPELPPVLNDISFCIRSGERIGIVGRTGAGKSSVLMALFRIVEAAEGQILIDGVDLRALPLAQARTPISIIPQDPVIFSGTIRSNLDPFTAYTDSQLWDSLDRAHLKGAVIAMEGKLDAPVAENGENLSVGQRQLLCLARALLRKNRILVLDEATANIDMETDVLVQKCIRKHFRGCTILTIAHRLNTVIDYDRILVLEAGQIAEFDTPSALLMNPHSHFSQLCAETGESNERALKSLAGSSKH